LRVQDHRILRKGEICTGRAQEALAGSSNLRGYFQVDAFGDCKHDGFMQQRCKHLCPRCKTRFTAPNRSYCQPCNTKQQAEWRNKNRERARANNNAWVENERRKIIAHYGGKCSCCGESHYEFLAIDHKFNNGNSERAKHQGSTWKLAKRRGLPDDYTILCHNCNQARAHFGICPHKKN